VLAACGGNATAEPEILAKNADLSARLPADAWNGPGAWSVDELRIATGHTTEVDALGSARGREMEEKAALEDAKRRLLFSALPETDREFFDITGEVKAAQTAAIYRLTGRQGLFAVLVAQASDVHAQTQLNADRARNQAKVLMKAGDFAAAARLLSRLTELGVQDKDTLDHAQAASAKVNLSKGIKGEAAAAALAFLSGYYERQDDLEASLKACHQLYLETAEPSRSLLEKLVDLSARTHRPNNAAAFHNEILQRWPPLPISKP